MGPYSQANTAFSSSFQDQASHRGEGSLGSAGGELPAPPGVGTGFPREAGLRGIKDPRAGRASQAPGSSLSSRFPGLPSQRRAAALRGAPETAEQASLPSAHRACEEHCAKQEKAKTLFRVPRAEGGGLRGGGRRLEQT